MKISENITIYGGMEPQAVRGEEKQEEKGGAIFAGNLNRNLFADKIEQRKKQAQEQAMKVVKDVWEGDKALDEDLAKRRERIDALKKEMHYAQTQMSDIDEQCKQLQKEYGVAPDSQEQKDLELLRRKNNGGRLTKEELEYTAGLEAEGLTEYQQRQLELDRERKIHQETYEECFKNIKVEIATISATRLERLKHSPMVNAQKQAEDIMAAASDEILGMLVEEGKAHIDEEKEKRQKQAEGLEEQKEEQEAFIEAQKEKRQEQEELIEEMPVEEMLILDQAQTDIQKEVQNIVDKMKLVAEDIKGAVVDQNV